METDKETTKQRRDQPYESTKHISPKSLLIVVVSRSSFVSQTVGRSVLASTDRGHTPKSPIASGLVKRVTLGRTNTCKNEYRGFR
jgi:hypothetical protein